MSRQAQSDALHHQCANTIRFLAVDAVEKANSGHPGMPMGMANVAAVLWTEFLNHDPQDPRWINRDRFVLSAGHGSALLYAVLHLAGYPISLDDLRQFRQWESRTPGHPEWGVTPGVETTTGPLGQGFANGVGMALAARMLAARFNMPDFDVIDHWIYAIVSDGDLMEGISHEAASLAGHLGLGRLIYFYDDNAITIEGKTDLAFSEKTALRFEGYGWHTVQIDGHDPAAIRQAILTAQAETARPSLIICKTHIGYGSPHKQDTASCHGAPLGAEEVRLTKEKLGWPVEPAFHVPNGVREAFDAAGREGRDRHDRWTQNFTAWRKRHPELETLWEAHFNPADPADLEARLLAAIPEDAAATRSMGGQALQAAAALYPGLVGGSADLAPSNNTVIKGAASVGRDAFDGRNLHFGIREHAMGALLNGMAVYGGFKPFGATFFVFSDYMRPPIRLAALMGLPTIFVFTHDSLFVGEDGPTHQPVEHLAALRCIPNVQIFRPADRIETAAAWAQALRSQDRPTVLCLTRQKVANLPRDIKVALAGTARGGYVVKPVSNPDLQIIGTGSELELAWKAAEALSQQGKRVRLISIPSLDRFMAQDKTYRDGVVALDCPVVVIEAGISQGWHAISRAPLCFIGMDSFGASAPQQVLAERFGLTLEGVLKRIAEWQKT